MFNFIKECIIDPIKEGWEEGRREQEEEKLAELEASLQFEKSLETFSSSERLALCFAAPFRAANLGEYFSFFSFDADQPKKLLPPFYQIGHTTEEQKKDLREKLLSDFGISTFEDIQKPLRAFSAAYTDRTVESDEFLDLQETFQFAKELELLGKNTQDIEAFSLAVTSYIVTSAWEIGLLTQDQATREIDSLLPYGEKYFEDWRSFGEDFLLGESVFKLNGALGRKVLAKVVSFLTLDPGSPWNNYPQNYKKDL